MRNVENCDVLNQVSYKRSILTQNYFQVPREFKPTLPMRGWLVPFFNTNPWYSAPIALAPALLGTILIFMDQQITAVIVNRKENKLKVSEFLPEKLLLMNCFENYFHSIAERLWISFRFIRPLHFNNIMFLCGYTMVCGCHCTLYKSCQFFKVRI